MQRRAFLRTAASGMSIALAGCSGNDGDSGRGSLDSYRDRLDTELDVTIRQLSVDDRVVTLQYESTHAAGSSEWGYEVGFVGGRFGREVSDGWAVDRLSAQVTGTDDRTLAWEVGAGLAQAFVEGEVPASAFIDRIFGSMREE